MVHSLKHEFSSNEVLDCNAQNAETAKLDQLFECMLLSLFVIQLDVVVFTRILQHLHATCC